MSPSKLTARLVACHVSLVTLTAACETPCFPNSVRNITAYVVTPNAATPHGVNVDTSGFAVDLTAIDDIVEALETCLGTEIHRECLTVKIAPDWYVSPCSGSEGFPCDIPQTLCENASAECPCHCGGVVQDDTVAVTTPNLASLAHEVTHIVTGFPDPFPPEIAVCADSISAYTYP